MGDFEWTNDLVIRLMEEYKKRPELWDSSHEMYRVQTLKYESWSELAGLFGCDIADLRKKLNSLFASHRREKAKIRGGGRSFWFLYPYMSFLPTHLEPDNVIDIEEKTPPRTKARPPIKEVLPSESEEEYLEDDHDDNDDDIVQEEVFVKQEPVVEYRPRKTKKVVAKAKISRPLKRHIKDLSTTQLATTSSIDSRLSEAIKLLRRSDMTRKKDECDSFGEYIADSLRKHDERTQSMIKQAINNILFEQEMKKYSNSHQYTVVLAGIDENPLILGDQDVTDK